MASHFSSIGLPVQDQKSFIDYFTKSIENGTHISTVVGTYTKWELGNGVELWGQVNKKNEAIGMNPHFAGSARMTVRLEKLIKKPDDTILDGSFYCWAEPNECGKDGLFPFVFDSPDISTYTSIKLPQVLAVQLAGFAHEISAYASDQEFDEAQAEQPKLASESFIPSGLFQPGGGKVEAPQALAIFTGHILDTEAIVNPLTGVIFLWAKIKTLGGEIDIVVDPDILEGKLVIDGVVTGSFWLSGRIAGEYRTAERNAFKSIWNKLKYKSNKR